MALEIKLSQKLSQTLVMTPQLQQAIKLLQLGRLEYAEVIAHELLENPVLEEVGEFGESDLGEGDRGTGQPVESNGSLQSAGVEGNTYISEEYSPLRAGSGDYSEGDWNGSSSFSGTRIYDVDEDKNSLEATVSNPEGLTSHLLWQLRAGDLSTKEREIISQFIGNLDRDGYLVFSVEEIAQLCGCSEGEVEHALTFFQALDPPGIGARDLRECLLIQLDQLGHRGTLAWDVVNNYLPLIETRRYDQIAKKENVPIDDVIKAIKLIQRLEPRPGRPFVDESPIYITPDVYVRKVGEDYVVSLNESGIPKLRLSNKYKELLRGSAIDKLPDREYIQDRVRSATWLIRSIHQRQQTILKVTTSIMKFQREFLEHGVSALRPLVLRDIAADVGMHESTVSRVTTNKYVHTPQGVFELKFFFSSALKKGSSEVSSEAIKERIKELVGKEDPKKPLSDQAIAAILKNEGVDIARRTVAKYREMTNILSSSRRKRIF